MPHEKGRAWIELDRCALRHNLVELNKLLPSGCELMPAIKANAYGHGMLLMARELIGLGVHAFCVATVAEGVELRRAGIGGDILILGYTAPEDFPLLLEHDLIQTIVDTPYAALLNRYGTRLRTHLKLDTGMHRLGVRAEDEEEVLNAFRYENLAIEGVFTHLCADDSTEPLDKKYTESQAGSFYNMIDTLSRHGYQHVKKHLLASYGLLNYPSLGGDYARIGIALYGVLSNRQDIEHCPVNLKPVLSLKARVSSVREISKGEAVGYGLDFVARQNGKIATLTIGYGDGLPRSLSHGRGSVLLRQTTAPIVGRICMDQTIVDISGIPNVRQGDTAVIIGKSGNTEITAYDIAEQSDTITNEILSRLGQRVVRTIQ